MNDQIATKEDFIKFLKLCQTFHAESRFAGIPFDVQRVHKIIQVSQANPNLFFVRYKLDENGDYVGVFIGFIEELYFGMAKQAVDLVFYVREDHRGGPWFVRTLRDFEDWAKETGCDFIKLTPNSGVNTEGMTKLYPRLGYELAGYIFSKEI